MGSLATQRNWQELMVTGMRINQLADALVYHNWLLVESERGQEPGVASASLLKAL